MAETIRGTVERVVFHNPDTGFVVLRVQQEGRGRLITVVGWLMDVTEGEHVTAEGNWDVDRRHGRQFRAESLQTSHPATREGIQRYLASGAVRCIGPSLAATIVDMFKERTLDVFDNHPELLLNVPGIGRKRHKQIVESWQQQRDMRQLMLFLKQYGLGSVGNARRIHHAYGSDAVKLIKANPYRLAKDIHGIGFKTADQMALSLGLPAQSPDRAAAAIVYCLETLAQEGHTGYPRDAVVEKTCELVNLQTDLVSAAVVRLVSDKEIIAADVENEPWLFLPRLYGSEIGIARSIARLLAQARHPLPAINVSKAVEWVQQRLNLELSDGQRKAIEMICRHKVVVVTGGPGVGKTTLVRSVVEIFRAKQRSCVLAAPTGRAAKRLAETTGRKASTIHRLLEFETATGGFRRNENLPLRGHLFVVDECSMIDVVLGHQLLRAVPDDACVVLVGDVDQLPSVGPGTVLDDLIASGCLPVVRLTEIFRQAAQSRIITAARDVNLGQLPNLKHDESAQDFYFIEADDPDRIESLLVQLVGERIPDRFKMNPITDVQVLAPMNRGQLGTQHLNAVLQQVLNPADDKQPKVERSGWTFRVGDRVIQLENNYDRGVVNGDLGVIRKIDLNEHNCTVEFDELTATYSFGEMDELALAYVLTIHKSQGSEYPCVVIVLHTQHFVMLRRNLLYTAITRGKQLVVIVGSRRALTTAVQRRDVQQRRTALKLRLQEAVTIPHGSNQSASNISKSGR